MTIFCLLFHRDCGVYVAAYAEFLSDGKDIPADLDPEEVRIRYASLLWNYSIQKLQAGAVSDSEAPLKPVRNRTENNSTERLQCSSFLPYS